MDLNRYRAKKARGLVRVIAAGQAFAIVARRFDAESGEEVTPELVALSAVELDAVEKNLLVQLDEVRALRADLAALNSAK